ncbi:3-hydroxyisobutyrate dehydrogenase [Aquabacterium sp.]|uniref:3-hydroxyisobutyrate dehydrogenase n=1 Tax=Aquabacterium sp. TaxID=1872578 RepID=UPI0035B20EBE
MKIAFIGLGNMGGPMARNLVKAGHAVRVFDLNSVAVQTLADAGAEATLSPADAVHNAEFVITMLPAAAHVKAVLTGPEGVFGAVPLGVPIVDCSTIDPASARHFAELAEKNGNPLADAPVSGGTGGATAGTLTFMVGASTELFARVQPVLQAMGKNIVHCGATGTGQVAKVCNNLLLAISMIGVAEAMTLGASLGIDPKVLAGIVNTSSGRCWSADTYNPYPGVMDGVPAARGYSGGFGVNLMLKDLGLATAAAQQAGQQLPLGTVAQQLYQTWSEQGHGTLDFSSIIQMLQAPSRS